MVFTMQYFGVPKCPYCGKRVNLVRSWSLKKEGEYRCPRCGGISNIFLSPLVYVFAVLAVFSSIIIYFYYKVIKNDVTVQTLLPVALPFILFFLLGIFMPYLKKPVIKKAPVKNGKKPRPAAAFSGPGAMPTMPVNLPEGEYLPAPGYETGAVYLDGGRDSDTKVLERTPVIPAAGRPRPAANRNENSPTGYTGQNLRPRPATNPNRPANSYNPEGSGGTDRPSANRPRPAANRNENSPTGYTGQNLRPRPATNPNRPVNGYNPERPADTGMPGGTARQGKTAFPAESYTRRDIPAQNSAKQPETAFSSEKKVETLDIPTDFFSKRKNSNPANHSDT